MNSTDAILVFIIGQLVYVTYKVGRLEAHVRELQRQVQALYTLLNKR
ncbi:MAG: hypothetical protein QXT28_11205 [Thermofilaceae archaeon]